MPPTSNALPALEPQIRRIAPEIVNAQWTNLSPAAQDHMRHMLRDTARPVLMRYREGERRIEAQAAIDDFLQSVDRKLPRFPFPPSTRDVHFEYEKMLDSNVRFLSLSRTAL